MKKYLFLLTLLFRLTFLFGQTNIHLNKKDTISSKIIKSEPTNWTMDWGGEYPGPSTTLVDLNEDHRYRISYINSTRRDVSHIVVTCLSMKRPELLRIILSKGQSIDIEGFRIVIEHYLYPPGNVIRCVDGCPTFKNCCCAYTGTIMALD